MFGFEYDSSFLHWAGSRLYSGIESAEQQLRKSAREAGMSPAAYRKVLQKRYKECLNSTSRGDAIAEIGGQ
jgi:lambda repressor-like predicted transcriptional regulator